MCYFKHKGLKTVFINLVTRPKLLLVGDEKSDPGDKAACSHCTVLERHCVAGKGAMLSGETSFLTGEWTLQEKLKQVDFKKWSRDIVKKSIFGCEVWEI